MRTLAITRLLFLILALVLAPLQGYAVSMDNDSSSCHQASAMQDHGDMDCHSDNSCGDNQQCINNCTDCGTCSTISYVPSIDIKIDFQSRPEQFRLAESDYPIPSSFVEPRPPCIPA
ncbi:MAG: hypothetical protein OEW89_12370 [Gammaproteobacteria bacterium]|nr:hypothetical protein [Gammaproteobacteria bacterium]MDH5594568.1 hypothetical protein [Gammaproteobacteria bacterium]MDH5614484.1 hypothetical protein [Gammaproteobacteria bacterium]